MSNYHIKHLEEYYQVYRKSVRNPEVFWDQGLRTELFSASIKEWMNVPFTSISNDFHIKYAKVLEDNVEVNDETIERESQKDNKIKLVEALMRLKQLAISPTNNTADYYYMMGNAYYNMSHQGWFMNNTSWSA